MIYGSIMPAVETITPGMLIEMHNDATYGLCWGVHDSANEPAAKCVALDQIEMNKTIDETYAAGDLVKAWHMKAGDRFFGIIPSGQNITQGALFQSNGDGKLKAFASGPGGFVAVVEPRLGVGGYAHLGGGAVNGSTRQHHNQLRQNCPRPLRSLLRYGGDVGKFRAAQMRDAEMRGLTPLWKNAQEMIDDAVIRVGREGLVIAADLHRQVSRSPCPIGSASSSSPRTRSARRAWLSAA